MKDVDKTREQLMIELVELRQRIAELETLEGERKWAENDLRILHSAIESSINAIGMTDLQGKLIYVNDSCVKMWGFDSKDEMLGRSLPEFWEGEGVYQTIKALHERGEAAGEDIGKRKDGSLFNVQFTANMIKDDSGNPVYMFGSFFDITERNRAEEELKKHREHLEELVEERTADLAKANGRLRLTIEERKRTEKRASYEQNLMQTLLDNIPDYIYFKDKNRRFVRASNFFCDLFGCSLEDIIGKKDEDLFPEEIAEETASDDRHVIETGIPLVNKEEGGKSIGRGEHWVLTTKLPWRDKRGNIIGLFGISREITDRKRAEEQLRSHAQLLDNVRESVVATDLEGTVIYWGKGAQELYGYRPEEVMGKSITFIVEPEEEEEEEDRMRQVFETGLWKGEYLQKRKDGSRFWADTVISLVKDQNDQPSGFIGIDRDITDRKKVEETLRDKTHALGERVKELNCLYGISHLLEKKGISLEEIFKGTADLIPPSWQYPEATCARINVEGREFITENFQETRWKQKSDIIVHGHQIGSLEVYYLSEKQESDEGPFLKEERSLIDAIAERLGRIIERVQAQEALRKAHDELERRVEERTVELKQEIKDRKQAEEALRESENQLRHLSSQLLSAQEDERKSVAQDLHDSIGQTLTAIKFGTEKALGQLPKRALKKIRQPLEATIAMVQNGIEEVRRIQMALRPPTLDDLGILATISWFCREFQTIYSGIRIEQHIDIQEDEVPLPLKTIIYRVMQEALSNIAKHSGADLVRLSLRRADGAMELAIEDNGLGFDLEGVLSVESSKRGIGVSSMKERIELSDGSFAIESATGAGTIIRASWPEHPSIEDGSLLSES